MSVKFFGKIDVNKAGNIGSSMPAWAMEQHLENLEEEVASKKRALERGEVPPDAVPQYRVDIEKEEKRLREIKESRPEIKDVDKIAKVYKDLGNKISESMFTRSDMKLGLADAHEEARRMSQPIIKVDAETAEICKENNIKVTEKNDGLYVTRNGASNMFKYIGRYLGENSNVEHLRRDGATVRTKYKS